MNPEFTTIDRLKQLMVEIDNAYVKGDMGILILCDEGITLLKSLKGMLEYRSNDETA